MLLIRLLNTNIFTEQIVEVDIDFFVVMLDIQERAGQAEMLALLLHVTQQNKSLRIAPLRLLCPKAMSHYRTRLHTSMNNNPFQAQRIMLVQVTA